jgi:mRNA interferase RelE/StbE
LAWTIEFERDAIRQLNRLEKPVRRRIIQFLEVRVAGSGNPRQFGKPMKGDMADFWAYRVGDYRILCLLEDDRLVVAVVSFGHRREVYR